MSNVLRNTSGVIRDANSLVTDEADYKSQVRVLTLEFLKKRMDNTASIESAKMLAVNKLMDALANDEDIPITSLLRIVETLGNQNSVDLANILGKMSTNSGKSEGNTYNIFQSPEPTPQPQQTGNPEVYKLLDSLVQISEAIAKDKKEIP